MLLGNTRCSARPDKGCLTYRGGRARLVHHIKCGGWASPPAEDSRTIPRPRDTWRFRTPTWCGRPDGRRRSRTPMGVRASAVSSELPFLRDTWRLWTHPQAGNGPGSLAWWGKAWPVGPGYSVFPAQLRITTRILPCRSKSGYPCYRIPTDGRDYN